MGLLYLYITNSDMFHPTMWPSSGMQDAEKLFYIPEFGHMVGRNKQEFFTYID
jgi:hypothetical protein